MIRIIVMFLMLSIIFIACEETITTDLFPPSESKIKSIYHYNHNFIIRWESSVEEDFKQYELYESNYDDMHSERLVYYTRAVYDTCILLKNIEYNNYRFYRIKVIDQFGNSSISSVFEGSSYPKILFESDRDGNDEIYMMEIDGRNVKRLTYNSEYDGWPRFSPDGSKFVFETKRDGNYEIYLYDFYRDKVVNLSNNSAMDIDPYYSPDGLHIIFISDRNGNREVYKMFIDGSEQVKLTSQEEILYWPTVSSDASTIAVVSDFNLYTLKIDGSEFHKLASPPHFLGRPRFSPDGTQITVTSNELETDQVSFRLINIDDATSQAFYGCHTPYFNPTGTILYFTNRFEGIYLTDLYSKDTKNMTSFGYDWITSITTSGNKIIFTSQRDGNFEIYSMDNDGNNQINLTTNTCKDWGAQIQPHPD